jgi:hypothetical protein
MKKLISLFLICFISAGCFTTGVKPSNAKPVKPIPKQELVITTPRVEQPIKANPTVMSNVVVPVEKRSFLSFKSPKEIEKTKVVALAKTNVASFQLTNPPTTNQIAKGVKPTKKKDWRGLAIYYSLVLSIGAIWFFYGRPKLLEKARKLLERSQKK